MGEREIAIAFCFILLFIPVHCVKIVSLSNAFPFIILLLLHYENNKMNAK